MLDGSLFALKYLPPNEESRSSGRQGNKKRPLSTSPTKSGAPCSGVPIKIGAPVLPPLKNAVVECAPDGGQFAGWELTGAAGLSEDESHGQAFRAMVAKDPDRSITLCDSGGEVVARHDPRPEQSSDTLVKAHWVKPLRCHSDAALWAGVLGSACAWVRAIRAASYPPTPRRRPVV